MLWRSAVVSGLTPGTAGRCAQGVASERPRRATATALDRRAVDGAVGGCGRRTTTAPRRGAWRSRISTLVGLGKLSRLEPLEPPNRYERRHAGELLHVDVKKLARIAEGRAGHRVHGNRRLQRSPRSATPPGVTAG